MRLKIVQVGEPVLRQQARPLLAEEIALPVTQQLIEWMRDTMRDAPGVGLAAPQIGLPLQLAVIEDRSEYAQSVAAEVLAERERQPVDFQVLINPRIVERSEEEVEFFEGCLSLTGFSALVKRSREVVVEALDEHGQERRIEARGWYARILQHEIDHLHGTLYIDRMAPRSFMSLENFNRYWGKLRVDAVREALKLKEG
ncbi:MAG TPA: peptide deformylase [Bryobacteraceae bacterium]|nr:peptide deformylase [Bryobacteraceae bacterium]